MRACLAVTGCCLALAAFVSTSLGQTGPKSISTSLSKSSTSPQTFDVVQVRIERGVPYRAELPEAVPPFVVGGLSPDGSLNWTVVYASRGRIFPGSRYIVGCLGDSFPENAEIVAERFERRGSDIRLTLRYVVLLEPKYDADQECFCFFGAPLPADLPDGDYRLSVELRDAPKNIRLNPSRNKKFEKPDLETRRRRDELAALKSLPLEQWIDRYRREIARTEPFLAPHEAKLDGLLVHEAEWIDLSFYNEIRCEMVARRLEISPYLIEALKEECVRHPEETGNVPGIARSLMEMLVEIGDAGAAPVLVDILAGRLRCNAVVRRGAIENLEKLSYINFRTRADVNRHSVRGAEPVEIDPRQLHQDQTSAYRAIAARYDRWFAEHPARGADTAPWFIAAAHRARSQLESRDLRQVFDAARFLRARAVDPHAKTSLSGDDWRRTTQVLAAILEQCEPIPLDPPSQKAIQAESSRPASTRVRSSPPESPEKTADRISTEPVRRREYRHRSTGEPARPFEWLDLLTSDRAIPEEYATLVIRFDRDVADRSGVTARYLAALVGRSAMEYRIETYRRLAAEAARAGIKIDFDYMSFDPRLDENAQQLVFNLDYIRYGIERWSGRTFKSDSEIDAWWAAARERPQAEWLRENLPTLAAQADAADLLSQYLFRQLLLGALPDPPPLKPDRPTPGSLAGQDPPESVAPFRVKWLAENVSRLQFNPEQGVFQLSEPAAASETQIQP
jgi:hypothetical protein